MDQEKDEHEGEHQVVGRDLVPKEGVGAGVDQATRIPTGQVAEPEQQGLERHREDEGDDPGEDDPEGASHRDEAEQPAGERRGEGRHKDAHHDGQPHGVGEDGGAVATDAGEGTDAQE